MSGLNRPENKRIINPTTANLELEWNAYFSRLEAQLNAVVASAGVFSFEGRSGTVASAAGDYTASEVVNVPAGDLAAVTVQAALNELDTDKSPKSIIATGSTALRALVDRAADCVNVKDFGALGNGAADDAAAFVAAIAVANASSTGGGFVKIPIGQYMLGSEVTIPAGVTLIGEGQGSIIQPLAVISSLFNITGGLSGVLNCELSNVSARATSGIRCTKSADNLPITIAQTLIASFNSDGILWSSGDRPVIQFNEFIDNPVNVRLTEDGRAGDIGSNYMLGGYGVNSSFTTQQAEGLLIHHNQMFPTNAGDIGVIFEGGLNNIIEANIIDQTGAGGCAIYLAGNADPIAQIKIKNNWLAGGSGGGAGLRSVGNVAGLSSSGNTYTSTNTSSAIGIDCADLLRAEFIGDSTFALTGKAYQMVNCDLVSMRDCKFDEGAQGTEDGNCSILWGGTEGVPTSRSDSSAYVNNWVGQANNPNLEGGTTGNPVTLTATGTDANININLVSKGASFTTASTAFRSFSNTQPNGYGAGSGGNVAQATSKSTGVTLNTPTGEITMNNASLAAGASVVFPVTCAAVISANDVPKVAVQSGVTGDFYSASVAFIQAGLFKIRVINHDGSAHTDAVIINYALERGQRA